MDSIWVTIACRDSHVEAKVQAALPGWWLVSRIRPDEFLSSTSPQGVWITDSPGVVGQLRRTGNGPGGLYLETDHIEFVSSVRVREPTGLFERSAQHLRAAVVTSHVLLAERRLLEEVEQARRRLGVVVTQFVRHLLLEPVPDERRSRSASHSLSHPVYLTTVTEYAERLGCTARHLREECSRRGFTPSGLRDLVLLRAVLEARLRLGSMEAVARLIGYHDGSSLRRAVRRLDDDRFDLANQIDGALEVIGELFRVLGLRQSGEPAAARD